MMLVAQRLASSGRWGGNVQDILNADGALVLDSYYYVNFINDYKNIYLKINEGNK